MFHIISPHLCVTLPSYTHFTSLSWLPPLYHVCNSRRTINWLLQHIKGKSPRKHALPVTNQLGQLSAKQRTTAALHCETLCAITVCATSISTFQTIERFRELHTQWELTGERSQLKGDCHMKSQDNILSWVKTFRRTNSQTVLHSNTCNTHMRTHILASNNYVQKYTGISMIKPHCTFILYVAVHT